MAERRLLWTTTDPRGQSVALVADVWENVLRKHEEMGQFFDQVRVTVEDPTEIYFDPETTARRTTGARIFVYYRRDFSTTEYAGKLIVVVVKVVLEMDSQQGYVETAHLANRKKRRAVLEWNR